MQKKALKQKELSHCPRTYIKWSFVVAGMTFGFVVYLVYMNIYGDLDNMDDSVIWQSFTNEIVLTEHTNEEEDYEKPVCKRLEEESERYETDETVYYGQI